MKHCKDHPKQNPYSKTQPKCWTCLWNAKQADMKVEDFRLDEELLFGSQRNTDDVRTLLMNYWEKNND